jgi:branched-subunit amino acid aminotransferase/4-amino-4-deoxychorismate lyase
MTEPLAYLNGEFIPASQLAVASEDLGFVQGVSISERLRTFGGQVFRLDDHLVRLARSLHIVDLQPGLSIERIGELVEELVARNRRLLTAGDDLGVSLFITPGIPARQRPTVGIKAYPLPFGQWTSYYERGQALTETGVRQVPESCWPAALKCRSRMHYYLADRQADSLDPGSRAVLLDQEGFISEASTANVLFYRHGEGLVSPPRERILPGVSLSVLAELASGLGLAFNFRNFRLDELAAADEILMCSTSPCVWPVTRLNGQSIEPGIRGAVYQQILAAWSQLVAVDIVAQARQFGFRQ